MTSKQKFELWSQALDIAGRFLVQLPKWLALSFIAVCLTRAIGLMAGKNTLASFAIFLKADAKANPVASHIFSWLLAGLATAYGLNERRQKRHTIARLAPASINEQQQIDPKRSSSQLTPKGTTRQEDAE